MRLGSVIVTGAALVGVGLGQTTLSTLPVCVQTCSAVTNSKCNHADYSCYCSTITASDLINCCAGDTLTQQEIPSVYNEVCAPYSGAKSTLIVSVTAGSGSTATSVPASSPSPSSSSSSNSQSLSTGAIAGIAVGGAAGGALAIAAIWFFCRRRRGTPSQGQHQQGPEQLTMAPHPPVSLNAQSLERHLASQGTGAGEWAGIKPGVQQKPTANQSVVEMLEEDEMAVATTPRQSAYNDGISRVSELRPQDAVDEPGYNGVHGDDRTRVFSEAPRTALQPASETVWHPRV